MKRRIKLQTERNKLKLTKLYKEHGRVKQNEIRQSLGNFKVPSGTQSSSHDTELAFMVRSNYREKS